MEIKNMKMAFIVKTAFFIITTWAIFSYIGVFKYIHNRPSSLHISAQCQRASIALNYYKTDMNFFTPRIQRQVEGEGITGVEFPIIYYTAAILYKTFGFNEVYLRVISLIIVVFGLYCFYLLAAHFIKNNLLSLMLVFAAALSPVLLFYTPNFMPDAPSMALQLAAWYYLFQYQKTQIKKHFMLFIFFGALAALIKATGAMVFAVAFCLFVLDKWKFFKTKDSLYLFPKQSKLIIGVGFGIIVTASWYYYASWLSSHHNNASFALKPLMVDDWNVAKDIFATIKNLWADHYYSYEAYVLMIASLGTIVLFFKYANKVLLSITVLSILGYAAYVYLFLYQFRWHDYYLIAILPGVFFLFLTFGEMVNRLSTNYFRLVNIVFIVILFFNMKESLIKCKKNYTERNTRAIYYWTGDYRAYEDLEPKLRKVGIKRTDKFISAFDNTYCSGLYLMDQLGVNISDESTPEEIKGYLENPSFKYLTLNDSAKFNKVYPNNLSKNVILVHRGLIIYKLR